jgi:hypothetical protein
MELIISVIGILFVLLILGLIFRKRGDGFMDTLGSGCKGIAVIIIIIIGVVTALVIANS